MFSLKCFGVGDGWPCADRNHASFLYRFQNNSVLIDCGESLSRSYKASGLSYDAFDRLIVSHLHSDHVGGLFMFLQGLWLERRTRPLAIHLPAGGARPIQAMLRTAFIFPELLNFKLRFEQLRVRRSVVSGELRITPFRSSHLDQMRRAFHKRYPQSFAAFCFLIEAGGLRIGHSADIGRPEDLEPLLRKPLDLLVCELAHFPREALFDYLKGRAIKKILFIHVARPYWEDLRKTRQLATRGLGRIPFTFARDNEEIRL